MKVYEVVEKIEATKREIDKIQNKDGFIANDEPLIDILTDYLRILTNCDVVCKGV